MVGAGPTGLAMAGQLAALGVRVRVVDRSLDRVQESRALAIQPRTLEVLASLGVTDEMTAVGNRAVRLCLHTGGGRVRCHCSTWVCPAPRIRICCSCRRRRPSAS
ncbi:FAD-dependent monooxygenase [Micromonospora saelicesensis]|uniref:FAD-dependent monooxygenase n=1 Tax=Micromonospora saelicesensis TaxID=285676 RepID=UPI0035A21E56